MPEGYTGEYQDTELPSLEDLKLEYLRGRGNSTWWFPKKPFKFKLKKSTDLLGMGANKHWVLLANAYDGTMLRNRIVGYMGRELGLDFSPMFTPVDLVINGEYRGSYTLAHQVRIGKSRVNIAELSSEDITEPEVTGGYLLQYAPNGDEGESNIFETKRGHRFTANDPVFESKDETETLGRPEQRDYIFSYLQRVEDAIYGEGFKDENGVPYSDLMDVHAAAAYWMVQEFIRNTDGFRTPSTYLYKDRSGKLCWGPLWDFDLTFDMESGVTGFDHCNMEWLDYLRAADPVFQEELLRVWEKYDSILTGIVKEGGLLDRYAAELKESWEDNKALSEAENWPAASSATDTGYDSLEEEVSKVKEFIKVRQEWFREHIDTDLTGVLRKLTFMANGEVIKTMYIYNGRSLAGILKENGNEDLALSSLSGDGYIAVGWDDEEGNPVDIGTAVLRDSTYTVRYVPEAEIIFADGLYFERYDFIIDIEEGGMMILYTTTPENAHEKSIIWETSDPEVATVDEEGRVKFTGIGDVTITGTLRSGAKASYQVHIRNREDVPEGMISDLVPESESLTLAPGAYGQIPINMVPNINGTWLVYYSDDENIAAVNEIGVIHAISPGTCTITVKDAESEARTTFTVIVKENEAYSITFDLNGGNYDGDTDPVVMRYPAGTVIDIPEGPDREGYTFTYWQGSEYYPGDKYTVKEDHTLIAQWEKEEEPMPTVTPTSTPDKTPSVTPTGAPDKTPSITPTKVPSNTPAGTATPRTSGNSPNTGDTADTLFWTIVFLLAALTAAMAFRKMRR